jgi:MerR family mercuric resistance operon transcriptional regulator
MLSLATIGLRIEQRSSNDVQRCVRATETGYNPLMEVFTIGQLAKCAGVPTSTLRYYERSGLLKPDARTGGNYRAYGERSLSRLKFIRSAQATGFSLDDIRELLSLTHDDEPCEEVITLTQKRLTEVRERIKELRHVEKVLAKSLTTCCTGNSPDLCDEIAKLKGPAGPSCKVSANCCAEKVYVRA